MQPEQRVVLDPIPFPDLTPYGAAREHVFIREETTGELLNSECICVWEGEEGDGAGGGERRLLERWEIGRHIRDSIYGFVHAGAQLQESGETVEDPNTGDPVPVYARVPDALVAIKFYDLVRLRARPNAHENPRQELACMSFLSQRPHPHVLQLLRVCEDENFLYAVLPYCDGGDLFEVVARNSRLDEGRAREWFLQFLQGLHFLQSNFVCHRDLSLENLMLRNDQVQIIDFGMSIRIQDIGGVPQLVSPQGVCGKQNYIPGEVYVVNSRNNLPQRMPWDGFASDIWCGGIILFIMLSGIPPVEVALPSDPRFRLIQRGMLRAMIRQWGIDISADAQDLLARMLNHRFHERITLPDILNHPWLQPIPPAPPVPMGAIGDYAGAGGGPVAATVEGGGGNGEQPVDEERQLGLEEEEEEEEDDDNGEGAMTVER